MKLTMFATLIMLTFSSLLYGSESYARLDSNVAFFEGETVEYVVYPPDEYRMVIASAAKEGYSFAFVPRESAYDDAELIIGVNYYKTKGLSFEEVLTGDTASLQKHYGTLYRPFKSDCRSIIKCSSIASGCQYTPC